MDTIVNIYSFEKLDVYNLARKYRKKIYKLSRKLPKIEQYNLTSQMCRAAVSLTNNIAEGLYQILKRQKNQYNQLTN